jgi:hypothetical protein
MKDAGTRRVKMLVSIASEEWDYSAGAVVEVPTDRARMLLRAGHATPTTEPLRAGPSICAMGHDQPLDGCYYCITK